MKRLRQSRAYLKAKSLVSATIETPAKLLSLVNAAQTKLGRRANNKLSDVVEPLRTSFRLIKAYASGNYRKVSLENLGLIVAAISYFVMPIDALPDFLMVLGLTDDAAILAWTFKVVGEELQRFKDWEHKSSNEEQP